MPSRTTLALAVLLLASLALNVRLWTRPAALRPPGASSPAAPAQGGDEGCEGCKQRLAACEQRSWEILRRTIAAESAPRQAQNKPPAPAASGVSAEEQERMLCEKAKQGLRDTWRRDRDGISAGLAKSLEDAAEQERNAASEAGKMRVAAGLDDREADQVAREYHDRRLARVAEARDALGRDPRDFDGLADAARGLYADEDAILERVGGAAARDAWRADQVEARTVLLALTAAMADRDWDASIRW
jgi:hypothetical protein